MAMVRSDTMRIQSKFSSIIVTFTTTVIAVMACCVGPATASSFSFVPFDVTAQDTNNIQSVPLTGAPAGTVFNGYTVDFDWFDGENIPQSHEASWAMVNQPPPQNMTSVFYADPGSAQNSKFNGNP